MITSNHPVMNIRNRLPVFACIIAALLAPQLSAQVTRTYTNGQNDTTAYSTSAPNNPTTLTIASGSASQSGILSGTGAVIKDGAGQLTIRANNTYNGGTTINAGTLRWDYNSDIDAHFAALGTGPVILNSGTLYLWRVNTSNPLTVNGGTLLAENGFGNTWSGPITLNANLNCNVFYTLTCSGNIGGTGGLNKTSGGPLILSGTNNYSGPTSVTAGTLQYNSTGAVAGGNLSISSGGAKVILNYTGTKSIGTLTLGGVLMTNPGTYGSLTSTAAFKSNYFEGNGLVSSGDPATAAFITSFGTNVSGSSAVIDSVVSNAANITWVLPSGTNLATLAPTFVMSPGATCSNRTSGAIPTPNFSAGPVVYNIVSPNTLVTNIYTVTATVLPAESTLIWNGGGSGAWNLAASNWLGQTSGLPTPFFSGVNVIFNQTAGGTITIASGMQPLSTTVSAASGTYTFSGGPIASGSLTKSGSGNLTIDAANTFSGGTIINSGQLTMGLQADAALGTGPVTLNAPATLFLNRINATNPLTLNGGTIIAENGFGDSWNSTVALNANTTINTQYNMSFGGPVSGAGGFIKTGSSRLTLAGSNSFTGAMTVQSGTLAAASLNRVSGGTATSSLGAPTTGTNGTISLGSSTSAGTLDYTGPGETTDRVIQLAGTTGGAILSQTGTPGGIATTRGTSGLLKFTSDVSIPGSGTGDNRKTLTLTHVSSSATGTNPGSGEISGSIGDSLAGNAGQRATSITKAGSGTWTLSGSNTYSGATRVQGGTLICTRPDSLGGGSLDITTGAKVRLDYIGTRQISALTFDNGSARPSGTYGSSSSIATNKDDSRFSGPGTVTVGALGSPTTTTLVRTTGSEPSNGSVALTFTATVAGNSPTGSVRFHDGLTLIGSGTLDGSYQAALTTSALGGGTHEITAQYVGDADNAPSTSTPLIQTVVEDRPATTTTLSSGGNPSNHGAMVNLTATVSGSATGSVSFYNGSAFLGTAVLNGSAQAVLTTTSLAVGWNSITARYHGAITHAPSATAAPMFQTVNPPAGNGKLKIFILAGQSNMQGKGRVETGRDPNNLTNTGFPGGLGSLRNMLNRNPASYGYLADPANPIPGGSPGWITRSDVGVTYWSDPGTGENRRGNLDANFGDTGGQGRIGPEYAFGLQVGSQLADNVLLIKYAFGGKSLKVDFRPPSSGGTVGPYYTGMVATVNQVLANLSTYYPAYTGGGYEISGFGWHQGWNDLGQTVAEYETNLTNLIHDLRAEFGVPDLPVVIANTGMANGSGGNVLIAQMNVGNPTLHPEFAGTVTTVDTRPFDFGTLLGGSDEGYHWNWNAESYFNIGESMGNAMMAMLPSALGSAYDIWAADPAQGLTADVNDGPMDDPDHDGIVNLMEFALGGPPMVSGQAILPELKKSTGGIWTFEYQRSNLSMPPATTQVVEYGSDLTGWAEVIIPATSSGMVTITPGSPSDHVKVILPDLGTKMFVRLKVTQ